MKKVMSVLLVVFMCVALAGCSNEFAEREYNSDNKIAQSEDRYAKQCSVFNPIDGGYSLVVSKFDGRETLWTESVDADKEIEIEIKLTLSEGTVKIVHVDEEGNITTIIECTSDSATDEYISKTVSLKEGRNRIKIVGYDCEDIDLELLSSDL